MRTELLIGGAWRKGQGERLNSLDPATDEIVWTGAEASAEAFRPSAVWRYFFGTWI